MMNRKIVLSILCLLAVGGVGLLQSACDVSSSDGSGQTGTLQVLLTDAPFPFDLITEASVTITRIEVRLSSSGTDTTGEESSGDTADSDGDEDIDDDGDDDDDADADATDGDFGRPSDPDRRRPAQDDGESEDDGADDDSDDTDDDDDDDSNDDADDDDDGDDDTDDDADEDDGDADDGAAEADGATGPFMTVLDEEVTFNLLDLQGGVTASLASSTLPSGNYTQVRLIVSSGRVVLTTGEVFDLKVPSGAQTGIKLRLDFDILPDDITTLLLDIDLSKAFVPIPGGNSSQIRNFLFKPSQAATITIVETTG